MFPVNYHKPAPALRPYVQFYSQHQLKLRDPLFVHPVPARCAPLLEFIFGDRFQVFYSGSSVATTTPRTVVVGMQTRAYAQLRLQGAFQSFVIVFHPVGMQRLFPVALRELTGHDYDSRLVLGKPISELDERLADCRSFQERVKTADAFLTRRIPDRLTRDRIALAADCVVLNDGRVRIPDLASSIGISQRQFEREFDARFGMRPKLFARIVRFQAALDRKARSNTKSWTDVAHEFGYYDQMHLIHDFREFTAGTPTDTLRTLEAFFREQIRLVQIGIGAKDPRLVPRFLI
jgi:AraC-like DNA-binding protein